MIYSLAHFNLIHSVDGSLYLLIRIRKFQVKILAV